MMAVAYRGLGHLSDQRLRVAQQDMQHLSVTLELILQARSRQPIG